MAERLQDGLSENRSQMRTLVPLTRVLWTYCMPWHTHVMSKEASFSVLRIHRSNCCMCAKTETMRIFMLTPEPAKRQTRVMCVYGSEGCLCAHTLLHA